jgi:hypothetical protein
MTWRCFAYLLAEPPYMALIFGGNVVFSSGDPSHISRSALLVSALLYLGVMLPCRCAPSWLPHFIERKWERNQRDLEVILDVCIIAIPLPLNLFFDLGEGCSGPRNLDSNVVFLRG